MLLDIVQYFCRQWCPEDAPRQLQYSLDNKIRRYTSECSKGINPIEKYAPKILLLYSSNELTYSSSSCWPRLIYQIQSTYDLPICGFADSWITNASETPTCNIKHIIIKNHLLQVYQTCRYTHVTYMLSRSSAHYIKNSPQQEHRSQYQGIMLLCW